MKLLERYSSKIIFCKKKESYILAWIEKNRNTSAELRPLKLQELHMYILERMRFVENVFTKVLIAMRKHHGHQMHLVDRNAKCGESMNLINH